jgi:hypothetical protein
VKACFCRADVPYGKWYDLVDHRYFFERNGHGNTTCGLVRNAVTDELLLHENFADTNFLLSLPHFIDNEAITGCMMEYAVLSSIQSKGLNIGEAIGTSMELRTLEGPPEFEKAPEDKPVLYRPRKFNFKAIDGVIILIKSGKRKAKGERKKLMMFPFQITVAPATHPPSREQFLMEYGWWITDLSKIFDVEVQFLWITPECRDRQEYPAVEEKKWPKHLERYIPFEIVDKEMWETYQDAQKKVLKNEAARRKLQKNNATLKKPTQNKAAPDQATPTQAVPDQATPDQAVPDQATPNQAAPDQAVPDQATPNQAAPDQATPNQATPKTATRRRATRKRVAKEAQADEEAQNDKA